MAENSFRPRSIVDVLKAAQGFGLRVREHPEFGGVAPGVHSPRGHHPRGEAGDVTDWRDEEIGGRDWRARTGDQAWRFKQMGILNEVLGPGDPGHDTHLHLALQGTRPISDAQLSWGFTGRWTDSSGKLRADRPPGFSGGPMAGGTGTLASTSADTVTSTAVETPAPDWRAAASDPKRITDPSQQGYWQREDIRQWAGANAGLARKLMEQHGAQGSWLTEGTGATPPVAASSPPAPAGAPPAPVLPAPQMSAVRPPDRGALNGTRVGMPGDYTDVFRRLGLGI